jgi:molecular chaperone GrpE
MIFGKKNDKAKREGESMSDDLELNAEETADEVEIIDPVAEPSELEVMKTKNTELLDRLQRTMAEFDNYRKRTIKEKAAAYDDGVRSIAEKLLPVIDNLERALGAAEDREDALYKGVVMIQRQFTEIMADIGVEGIMSLGETFDPNLHNAVAHVDDDAYGDNEIVQELLRGYKYNDKVIRPAMVKVAN